MANGLITDLEFIGEAALQYLFGSLLDVVGVYNGFNQVYVNARPLKAYLRETSRIMEHPAETGVVLADHHVIEPVEIEIPLMISAQFYSSTYQQIKTDFLAPTLLTVKTPVNVYNNMIIAEMPHEENPEFFNAITMLLHLRQVIYFIPGAVQALPSNYSPADPANQNTVQTGLQQAAPTATTAASLQHGATGAW